jgi:integrase
MERLSAVPFDYKRPALGRAEDGRRGPAAGNIRQQETRLGNWLTREQAKELLAVPDRSTLKGKRDYVILALLVDCALRRRDLAHLYIEEIQMRENCWGRLPYPSG